MNHNDDVSAGFQGQSVTGFLIAAIAFILIVHVDLHTLEATCYRDSIVSASIIDENDHVHQPLIADFSIGLAEGAGGVVSRHHDDYFLVSIHKRAGNRD